MSRLWESPAPAREGETSPVVVAPSSLCPGLCLVSPAAMIEQIAKVLEQGVDVRTRAVDTLRRQGEKRRLRRRLFSRRL